jgi:hypothetical protein
MTDPHLPAITPMSQKAFTSEKNRPHNKANAILQFFLDLLHVIGGDLNTGKSASFKLFHRWTGGKSSLLRIHDSHPDISLIHPYTGISTIVPKKEKDDRHRELGWMMTIDGKSTT